MKNENYSNVEQLQAKLDEMVDHINHVWEKKRRWYSLRILKRFWKWLTSSIGA